MIVTRDLFTIIIIQSLAIYTVLNISTHHYKLSRNNYVYVGNVFVRKNSSWIILARITHVPIIIFICNTITLYVSANKYFNILTLTFP